MDNPDGQTLSQWEVNLQSQGHTFSPIGWQFPIESPRLILLTLKTEKDFKTFRFATSNKGACF